MLTSFNEPQAAGEKPGLTKTVAGRDVTPLGAFARGTVIRLDVTVPRSLGAAAVVLRVGADGEEPEDLPFSFLSTALGTDLYSLKLDTSVLAGEQPSGLFFYELLFVRGADTLFTDSVNNVDFLLTRNPARRFRLLVYEPEFRTPSWFAGGTMYHVFLDRFCRGEGKTELRPDAELNGDWEHGIPQYAKRRGEALANNVFFGGNLYGVAEKLDYLRALGVTVLYLSPIFEAASNHRYDTADYTRVDRLLGGEPALRLLLDKAHAAGLRVILDGVFNHTGDDSVYFNRRGNYLEPGAYQSRDSAYASWYRFTDFPDKYECWWGIEILPRLNHASEDCRRYFTGKDGIAARWLRFGADGWRLDVADELSDLFLDELRETVKAETGGDGLLIGEVWENAADKVSYGQRRRYFGGRQLDSVMNYPFRDAVLAFLRGGDAVFFYNTMTELYGTYPPEVSRSLMNVLGTHDTERILTVLGDKNCGNGGTNEELARRRLPPRERERGIRLLKLASVLQFTVFGVPSVYYGDETGLEGYHDPFCRMPFPWGRIDEELLSHYRALGKLRETNVALRDGTFAFFFHTGSAFGYERKSGNRRVRVYANMGSEPVTAELPGRWKDVFGGKTLGGKAEIPPEGFLLVQR